MHFKAIFTAYFMRCTCTHTNLQGSILFMYKENVIFVKI